MISCYRADNCESVNVDHQLDRYVMRLLTASLTINSSLKNYK